MPYFNVMKSACSPINELPRKCFPWCFPAGNYQNVSHRLYGGIDCSWSLSLTDIAEWQTEPKNAKHIFADNWSPRQLPSNAARSFGCSNYTVRMDLE